MTVRARLALVGARLRAESAQLQGFMQLLMKPRNGVPWSQADRTALRAYLKRLGRSLPLLGLFALPGGSLLLPLLAFVMDRRRDRARTAPAGERRAGL